MDDFRDTPTRPDIYAAARAYQDYEAHRAAEYYRARWEREELSPVAVNEFADEPRTAQIGVRPEVGWVTRLRDRLLILVVG